ncbi:hypothetical protein [Leptospira santarosai]
MSERSNCVELRSSLILSSQRPSIAPFTAILFSMGRSIVLILFAVWDDF